MAYLYVRYTTNSTTSEIVPCDHDYDTTTPSVHVYVTNSSDEAIPSDPPEPPAEVEPAEPLHNFAPPVVLYDPPAKVQPLQVHSTYG